MGVVLAAESHGREGHRLGVDQLDLGDHFVGQVALEVEEHVEEARGKQGEDADQGEGFFEWAICCQGG